jgi:hypothetical protein
MGSDEEVSRSCKAALRGGLCTGVLAPTVRDATFTVPRSTAIPKGYNYGDNLSMTEDEESRGRSSWPEVQNDIYQGDLLAT